MYRFFNIVNNKPEVIIQIETSYSLIYPWSGKSNLVEITLHMNCFLIYFCMSIPHFLLKNLKVRQTQNTVVNIYSNLCIEYIHYYRYKTVLYVNVSLLFT